MSGVWALVPVKSFARAKSRLAGVLGPAEREALARSMFEHVLRVLASSGEVGGVTVVTDGDDVATLARSLGAAVMRDAARRVLSHLSHQLHRVKQRFDHRRIERLQVLCKLGPLVGGKVFELALDNGQRFGVV